MLRCIDHSKGTHLFLSERACWIVTACVELDNICATNYVPVPQGQNPPQHRFRQRINKRWRRVKAFASNAGDWGSIPGRDRPKLLKPVVTAPLATGVSVTGPWRWPLSRVGPCHSRCGTLKISSCYTSFSGFGDVSKWVKYFRVRQPPPPLQQQKNKKGGEVRWRLIHVWSVSQLSLTILLCHRVPIWTLTNTVEFKFNVTWILMIYEYNLISF